MAGKYNRLLDISAELSDFVGKEKRKLGLRIDRRLVLETPVDTASARGSWLVSDNSSNGSRVNYPESESVSAATQKAIDDGAANIQRARDFSETYIFNNQPYIIRLNEGSSQQAPSNYIDAIVAQEVARK
jgi:hypothetical protein